MMAAMSDLFEWVRANYVLDDHTDTRLPHCAVRCPQCRGVISYFGSGSFIHEDVLQGTAPCRDCGWTLGEAWHYFGVGSTIGEMCTRDIVDAKFCRDVRCNRCFEGDE